MCFTLCRFVPHTLVADSVSKVFEVFAPQRRYGLPAGCLGADCALLGNCAREEGGSYLFV